MNQAERDTVMSLLIICVLTTSLERNQRGKDTEREIQKCCNKASLRTLAERKPAMREIKRD